MATPAIALRDSSYATLSECRQNQTLSQPEVRRGHVGIKIVSLIQEVSFLKKTARIISCRIEHEKFTVAAALEKLTPDYLFVTTCMHCNADENGTVKGASLYGRGDVSVSTLHRDQLLQSLDDLAAKSPRRRQTVEAASSPTLLLTGSDPAQWEWDYLQWITGPKFCPAAER